MRTLLLVLLLLCSSFSKESTKRIGILFFNNCEPSMQQELIQDIRTFYRSEVIIYKPIPLPKHAYYPQRGRYRADSLLNYLHRSKASGVHLLAFTDKDISSTHGGVKDWGVLGLGDLKRGVSVSSTCRAKRGNPKEIKNIILNTALHEIGHTYGLLHCPNKRCLMRDAEGHLSKWDKTTPWMCANCRRSVGI